MPEAKTLERSHTYAKQGSDEFNAELDEILVDLGKDVVRDVGQNMISLILGGGYGRGEGGVQEVDGRELPFNDLDLTMVVRDKSALSLEALDRISEKYAAKLKIHVDFSRPLTVADIRNWPHWLMWHDLLNGHIVIAGDAEVLTKNAPENLAVCPPPIEATRLLLNRGAGLLWARRVVGGFESEPDEGFLVRNYQKCVLAIGDALLLAHKRFITPYTGRGDLLKELARDVPEVAKFTERMDYDHALEFKFWPSRASNIDDSDESLRDLAALWCDVWLHVETLRSGIHWSTIEAYGKWMGLREPEENTLRKLPRNLVRNFQLRRLSFRYPRESLYPELPFLITQGVADRAWSDNVTKFLKIWDRFN